MASSQGPCMLFLYFWFMTKAYGQTKFTNNNIKVYMKNVVSEISSRNDEQIPIEATKRGRHRILLISIGIRAKKTAATTIRTKAWNDDDSLEAKQIEPKIAAFNEIAGETMKACMP